jgi:hypothetical protein
MARATPARLSRQLLATPDPERAADMAASFAEHFNATAVRRRLPVRLVATRRDLHVYTARPGAMKAAIRALPDCFARYFLKYVLANLHLGELELLADFNKASRRAWRSVRNTKFGRDYQRQVDDHNAVEALQASYRARVECAEHDLSRQVRLDQCGGELTGDVSAGVPHEWHGRLYLPVSPIARVREGK